MELQEIMKGVELFDGLENDEIDQVINLCQERQYKETEIVAKQNSPGDEFFIIQEGFVEVVVSHSAGETGKVIVNLGTGQTVGEMSLVDQGSRSATIRAVNTPTILQVIKEKDFEDLCNKNTRIGYIVMRNIAADLSFRLRQRHLSDTIG